MSIGPNDSGHAGRSSGSVGWSPAGQEFSMDDKKKIEIVGGWTPESRLKRWRRRVKEYIEDPKHQSVTTVMSTVVMAFFTAILTWVAVRQYFDIQSNSADAKVLLQAAVAQSEAVKASAEQAKLQATATQVLAETAKAQSEALKASAETAKRGLNVTIESFKLDQRAWVGVSNVLPISIDPKQNQVTITLVIRNTGRTPALEVTSNVIAGETALEPLPPKKPESSSVLLPNETFHLSIKKELPPEEIQKIVSGKRGHFVFGSINYKDAFNRKHFTTLRIRYNSSLNVMGSEPEGNTVDQ